MHRKKVDKPMAASKNYFSRFSVRDFCLAKAPSKKTDKDFLDGAPIITDPNGSYTGRPQHPEEKPVQDADDL